MNLLLDDEQQQIVDATSTFVSEQLPIERLHGKKGPADRVGDDVWQTFAELGWLSMTLPEDAGGIGYTDVEECLVFREMGRTCAPPSILFSALAGKVAVAAGNLELAEKFATGKARAAFALNNNPKLSPTSLTSRTLFDFHNADFALTIDGDLVRLIDLAGLELEQIASLDRSVSMAKQDLSSQTVVAEAESSYVRQSANLLISALYVGLAEEVKDLIVDYAKIRETFGKPIGSYQAVRHPCADMAIRAEAARCQLYFAALVLANSRQGGQRDVDLQVSAARALSEQAGLKNVDDNIQLHGGIGVTSEFTAHLYLKRAQTLRYWFGSHKEHLETVLTAPMTPI